MSSTDYRTIQGNRDIAFFETHLNRYFHYYLIRRTIIMTEVLRCA